MKHSESSGSSLINRSWGGSRTSACRKGSIFTETRGKPQMDRDRHGRKRAWPLLWPPACSQRIRRPPPYRDLPPSRPLAKRAEADPLPAPGPGRRLSRPDRGRAAFYSGGYSPMAAEVLLTALGLLAVLLAWKGRGTLHERLHPGLYRSVDFPEERFPAHDGARFRERRRAGGYERMKTASLVICGITRNDGGNPAPDDPAHRKNRRPFSGLPGCRL